MAANVDVTVTGTLVNGAGAAIGSAEVKTIRQNKSDLLAATMNTDDTIEATSNASTGIFSLTLKGYDIMPVTYKVVLPDGQYFYLPLPANAKSVGLGRLTCGTSPSKGVKDITAQVIPGLQFIGQDLASAAALPQPTCDVHVVTGAVAITSITATNFPVGKKLVLTFAGAPTFTDGGNLKLTGNYVASADDSILLYYNGTDFLELGRSGAV
jgi:hypothetical protein